MSYPLTGAPPSTSLKPGDIDTLAELNALVTDATLIDTGDLRLSDARTPTAHAASHASGSDQLTPADIGAATSAQGLLADTSIQPGDVSAVSVTAYAAVGDGLQDDTSAIQDCLDSGALNILFPPGSYLVSDRIKPHAGQKLFGYGATIVVDPAIALYDDTLDAYENWVIWPHTSPVATGVEVRGLTIDLSGGGNTAKYHAIGGALSGAENILVKDCRVEGGQVGYGGIYFKYVVNLTIINNFIRDLFGANGFGIKVGYSKNVIINSNRLEFIGVKRHATNRFLPNSSAAGDWANVGALWAYGNAGVRVQDNYIYATGGSALKIDSATSYEGADTICTGNHVIGSGGGGVSLQLKLSTHDWFTKCVFSNNEVIGWDCGPGSYGHSGVYVGGRNTTTFESPENINVTSNIVTHFAPWEIPSFNAGALVITGSYNSLKDQVQTSGTYVTGSCYSLNYLSNFNVANNIGLFSPGKSIGLLQCFNGGITGNTSKYGGWNAARGVACGIHASYSAVLNILGNTILDHTPGGPQNVTAGTYYQFENSTRILFSSNIASRSDTSNCPLQYAVIMVESGATFTLFGLSEVFNIDIGSLHISGLDQLNMVLRVGSGNFICRQSSGGSVDLTMGATQVIYPWFKTVRKTNTANYTGTLFKAANSGTAQVSFINEGSSGNITIAVQSGEKLNGTTDGTLTVTPDSFVVVVCNGIDGWRTTGLFI